MIEWRVVYGVSILMLVVAGALVLGAELFGGYVPAQTPDKLPPEED